MKLLFFIVHTFVAAYELCNSCTPGCTSNTVCACTSGDYDPRCLDLCPRAAIKIYTSPDNYVNVCDNNRHCGKCDGGFLGDYACCKDNDPSNDDVIIIIILSTIGALFILVICILICAGIIHYICEKCGNKSHNRECSNEPFTEVLQQTTVGFENYISDTRQTKNTYIHPTSVHQPIYGIPVT